MTDYTPVYTGGVKPFTSTASAAITGGQVVEATTTGAIGPAGAASTKVVGVAAHDAASGARVTVWPIANCIHETTSPAGAAVGVALIAAAAGTVNPVAAETGLALLGVTLTTGGAGTKVRWIGR
ncbi:hypothetical protein [Micromonospora sp. NPDC023633]|uniref:hypothetical protein n=1 Tax=Micromonospora sp. NPDC023633 TaxID=3154320 RepID=UPI0033CD605D